MIYSKSSKFKVHVIQTRLGIDKRKKHKRTQKNNIVHSVQFEEPAKTITVHCRQQKPKGLPIPPLTVVYNSNWRAFDHAPT